MHVVHLMASPFVGGPEQQVLGMARALPADYKTTVVSFAERGLARALLGRARDEGLGAVELKSNFPRVGRAVAEVAGLLRELRADVVCTSGYKPDLIGWRAARRAGVPAVAIAHGWTGATWRVRLWETMDALAMRFLDAVVCVSEAMAARVIQTGVSPKKVAVIRNAIDPAPYDAPCPGARRNVEAIFARPGAAGGAAHGVSGQGGHHRSGGALPRPLTPCAAPPARIVGAVGRLSPEKGFDLLIAAAATVCSRDADVGFVVFGDGPLRGALEAQVAARGLQGRVVLPGFRPDLPRYLPGLDLAVSSSRAEGLPVALLEALAAGRPVVATAVGGTPEVVTDGECGYLVPPGRADALAEKIALALADDGRRREMSWAAWRRAREDFAFAAQAEAYQRLFARLVPGRPCYAPA